MVDRAEYNRWRAAGEDAVRAAETQHQAGLHNWSCFMAGQAAQLAIKGLLHAIGAGAWGHDLKVLEAALATQFSEAAPERISRALSRLARHYIPTRYPDAQPGGPPADYYSESDASQAIEDANDILRYLADLWDRIASASEAP